MKIASLIPWRETPTRLPAFEWVHKWHRLRFDETLVAETKGVFNKSALINRAVETLVKRGADVVVIGGADAVVMDRFLATALYLAYETDELVFPFNKVAYLNAEQSKALRQRKPRLPVKRKLIESAQSKDGFKAYGLFWVLTPKLFNKTGGMDEDYEEHGHEDRDFVARLAKPPIRLSGTCVHQWHEPNLVGRRENRRLFYRKHPLDKKPEPK